METYLFPISLALIVIIIQLFVVLNALTFFLKEFSDFKKNNDERIEENYPIISYDD